MRVFSTLNSAGNASQLVLLNGPVMVDQVRRKLMTSVLTGYEIEIARVIGGEGRENRLEAGAGDRARGQPFIFISIVRGVDG